MLGDTIQQIKNALLLLITFTILTGFIYPAIVTAFAQLLFPWKANGSLFSYNNKLIGSYLIGQSFTDNKYFWGRPSATTPYPYNAANSSGSNSGPSNPDFLATVKQRIADLKKTDINNHQLVPIDLVTASGSGLDPEISPFAAFYQVPRIAKARNLPEESINTLVLNAIVKRSWSFLGEPRVNVLALNLALDKITVESQQGIS